MIGGLKHQIDLLGRTRVPDAVGGAAVAYESAARVWAAVTPLPAIVAEAGGRRTRLERIEARIRRRHAVGLGQRLSWRGKTYEIVSIENDGAGERYVLLIAEETR
ncbi:MAG: head-tail adaptor protein [Parvularculaceae bacterium]